MRNRVWMPRTHRHAGWARWASSNTYGSSLTVEPSRNPDAHWLKTSTGVSSGFSSPFIKLSLEILNMFIGSLFLLFLEICYYIYLGRWVMCVWATGHMEVRGQSAVGSFPLCGSQGLCSGHLAWQEASWPAEPSHLPNWYDLIVRTCLKELGLCLHILTRQCVHMCMNTLAQVDTRAGMPYIQIHEKKKTKCFQNRQEYKKAGECHSRDMTTQNNYYSTLEMTAEQGKNGLCVIACLVYISMHVHVCVGACVYECQRSSLSQESCTLLFKQCLSLMWTSGLLLWLVSDKIHLSSESQHQNHKLVLRLSFKCDMGSRNQTRALMPVEQPLYQSDYLPSPWSACFLNLQCWPGTSGLRVC